MKNCLNLFCKFFFIITFISFKPCSFSQDSLLTNIDYKNALDTLKGYLKTPTVGSFKDAVFVVENTYLQKTLSKSQFDGGISFLTDMTRKWASANYQKNYHYSDSINLKLNYAIFKVLKDTIKIKISNGTILGALPYTYDFNDFFGEKDWSNMFVTKLLATHSGNCHSLPYLYKILADELGTTCWLSLAPNHMYIKNRCKQIGWYNTELTSGDFPIDAWIMASGYLPLQAIQNGIYMDTLSNQEDIALCVLDLAKGYEHQTKNYYDGFIIKCCDLSLQYFRLNVQAMLLKAETLKRVYEKQRVENDTTAKDTYNEMEQLYAKLFDLGYREMPEKMYQQWLQSVMKEKEKYTNQKVNSVINKNKTK